MEFVHVAVLFFLVMVVIYLYMLGKVLRGEQKLHVANYEQIRWIVYDNKKIKQDVIFLKKMFKINMLSGSQVYHYHAIIR